MRARLLSAIGGVVVLCACAAMLHAQDDVALRAEIDSVLPQQGLTGAVWAMTTPDGRTRTGAAGLRDARAKLPFADTTRVHVGSIAKTVLATGLLRLATEGRVDLDQPVARYLPDVAIDNPWAATDPLTVRHLLDFTSGLEDARFWQVFSTKVATDLPLTEAITRNGAPIRLRTRPGERMSYSNLGYTIAAMVIEAVTDTAYEQYLDHSLLAPLGMTRSTFAFTTQEGPAAHAALAWGHLDEGAPHAAAPMALRPPGQFTTTAGDLARFAQFLMSDGSLNGNKTPFISPELMQARGRPLTTEAARAGLVAGYALGLTWRDRNGVISYCHGGSTIGFSAILCIYPSEQKSFAVVVNTDSETADYDRVHAVFIRALDIRPQPAPPIVSPAADVSEWEGIYRPAPNRFESFAYLDALFGQLSLRREGEGFVLSAVQSADRTLQPTGAYTFRAADRATTSHVLIRGTEGGYRLSTGFSTFERTHPLRVVALWSSLALGLLGLLWFLGAGIATLVRKGRSAWREPEFVPFLGVIALATPLPLFLSQSFLQLGDRTPASVLLAVVTLLLPVALVVLIGRLLWTPQWSGSRLAHLAMAAAALQWCAVLAWWGLIPLRLWS